MSRARRITLRLAACLATAGLSAGLALAAAGSAQAAVPNQWGFAFVNNPSAPSVPVLSHQAGSWPAPLQVHSMPAAGHRVIVTFPRIASQNGVVHVTAVNSGPVWCDALTWQPSGPNEIVLVGCYRTGGVPVFSPFTVLYTTSSKGPFPAGSAYGYVRFQPGPGIVARFNSSGSANVVTPGPVGVWQVRLPGLGSAVQRGNVQVTAVNPSIPAKCQVRSWTWNPGGQTFIVQCFGAGTTPLKTGWTLSYTRVRAINGAQPKFYAYTFNNMPLSPVTYTPAPPGVNFNSQGGVNKISPAGPGLRLVTMPKVGLLPNTVLVTPFAAGPGFCNLLTVWGTAPPPSRMVTIRDVACYTAAGARQNVASMITYTAAH